MHDRVGINALNPSHFLCHFFINMEKAKHISTHHQENNVASRFPEVILPYEKVKSKEDKMDV